MNALTQLIQNRNSANKLTSPAPDDGVLHEAFKAALRAPDHAALRPWRFVTFSGDNRNHIADLLVEYKKLDAVDMTQEQEESLRKKAYRAPLIVCPIVKLQEHPKVPEIEQYLSCACAVQNFILALESYGYGSMWRTGNAAFSDVFAKGLELADYERLIGFIYVGSRDGIAKKLPELAVGNFVMSWGNHEDA